MTICIGVRSMICGLLSNRCHRVVRAASGIAAVGMHVVRHLRLHFGVQLSIVGVVPRYWKMLCMRTKA